MAKALAELLERARLRAFHGSPYKFDEFSDEAIGSGEGAQAYGYGHYFAEREGTAISYRDALTKRNMDYEKYLLEQYNLADKEQNYLRMEILERAMTHDTPTDLRELAQDTDYDDNYRQTAANVADEIETFKDSEGKPVNFGSMYEVEIDAQEGELLDYDKPLSEQPVEVRKAIDKASQLAISANAELDNQKLYDELVSELYDGVPPKFDSQYDRGTGADALRNIAGNFRMSRDVEVDRINKEMRQQSKIMQQFEAYPGAYGQYSDARGDAAKIKYDALMKQRSQLPKNFDEMAAQALKRQGVKGIQYADAQTRFSPGKKTKNYVIFDPRLIEISRRYGIPITAAATMLQQQDAQAADIPTMEGVAERAQTFASNRDNKNKAWTGLKDAVGKMTQPFQPLAEFLAHSAAGMASGAGSAVAYDTTDLPAQTIEQGRQFVRDIPQQMGFGPIDENAYQVALNQAMEGIADTVINDNAMRAFVDPVLQDVGPELLEQYQQLDPRTQGMLSGLGEYIGNAIR